MEPEAVHHEEHFLLRGGCSRRRKDEAEAEAGAALLLCLVLNMMKVEVVEVGEYTVQLPIPLDRR